MSRILKECIVAKDHDGATLVCEENGRRVIFQKPQGSKADKIKIDGCYVRQATACDYLVIDWKNRHHFVELKGSNVEHALEQLKVTVSMFFDSGDPAPVWCFVASTRSAPAARPGIQNKKARIKKAWKNAVIEIRTNQHVHTLT